MTAHVPDDVVTATVEQLDRLGVGSSACVAHVHQVAETLGVDERTVYRWVAARPNREAARRAALTAPADDELDQIVAAHRAGPDRANPGTGRARFDIDTLHLTVYAQCMDARTAWRTLRDKGLVDVSYPTFMRALARTDPARVAGAVEGFPGVVRNRQYLRYTAPHRNHTMHADHTHADVWVLADHRTTTPIRPHLTVIVDAYSGLLSGYLWTARPTGEDVAGALAETAMKREYHGVTVGGVPELLRVDNGAENMAAIITHGARRLGWIVDPVMPYSSWQNGKAERAVQLVNDALSNRAPGALHGGTTREKKRRYVASTMATADPQRLWTMDTLRAALDEVVDHLNTQIRVERLGGMTRLEAYAADPTEQRFLSDVELRTAMLHTAKRTYRATKSGVHFDKGQYVGAGLHVGRAYTIRHLPHGRDFIEVFTEQGEHVARAWRVDRMPEEERHRLLADRAHVEREARAIEAGVVHFRDRVAAAGKALTATTVDDEAEGVDLIVPPDRPSRGKARRRRSRTADAPAPKPDTDDLDLGQLVALFGDTLPADD